MQNRITVRMTDEMIVRLDAWIAGQPGYVSRQEAVRRLVGLSFLHLDGLAEIGGGKTNHVEADTAGLRARLDTTE